MSTENSMMPSFPFDVGEGITKWRPKMCNASVEKAPVFQVGFQVNPFGFSVNLNFGWRKRETLEILFFDE